MKKFVFNLESVLGLREWEEQLSRQAFSEASSKVVELEERIRNVEVESQAVFENWSKVNSGSFSRNDRLALISGADALSQLRAEAESNLEEANRKRDEAMAKLSEAIRAKKVVENLKQRRLEEYQAETLRADTQEIEDIFNARRKERSVS